MIAFQFDSEAALKRAREPKSLPNPPNLPNRDDAERAGLGELRASYPEMSFEGFTTELALDLFEERAAIRQHDGGQPCAEAEVAALHEVASRGGVTPEALCASWKNHPDTRAYLAAFENNRPQTIRRLAEALDWPVQRAQLAACRLRASRLLERRARPIQR